jgi:hypothetical protein
MGLDMYLYAEQYVSGGSYRSDEERETYVNVVNSLNAVDIACSGTPTATISLTVGYWRKDNHIHNWFVNNVQRGVDDCGKYEVEREELEKLCDLLLDLLKHRGDEEYANTHLPTSAGFFFGSTEYDHDYWQSIDETYKMIFTLLKKTENTTWEFYYQSSW